MSRPDVFDPRWDAEQDQAAFRWRRARVGRQAGARELGASVFDVPPGASTFPLHAHHANEEILAVLEGRPTLRTIEVSTMIGPDVVEHIDSQKVYARSFAPGADPPEYAVEVMVKREDSREFFEGEH